MRFLLKLKVMLPIIAVLVLAVILLIYRQGFSGRVQAGLEIDGPNQVLAIQKNSYRVRIHNKTAQKWNNVRLKLEMSNPAIIDGKPVESLLAKELGELDSGQKKEAEFSVRLLSGVNSEIILTFRLSYQPEGASSVFEAEKALTVKTIGNAVEINFDSLSREKSGQLAAGLTITNKDRTALNDLPLTLQILYPERFSFTRAEPAPDSEKNRWYLNPLAEGESQRFAFWGWVSGPLENLRPFQARVFTELESREILVAEANSLSQVAGEGLVIFQNAGLGGLDSIDWGQQLGFLLSYRNATATAFSDLKIEVQLDPALVDWSRSSFSSGSFNASSGIVVFDKTTTPQLVKLDGGQNGSIAFTLVVVSSPPPGIQKNANFRSVAVLRGSVSGAGETEEARDILNLKVKTKAGLLSRGFYQSQYFAAIGQVPPRVGQETAYTIVWQVNNLSNNISNTEVSARLGPNVKSTGLIFPKNSGLRYDEQEKRVIWDIGLLNAGTGFDKPAKQVAFQILFKPTAEQVGQLGLLVGQAKLTGIDAFASTTFEASAEPIYTDLPEDPTAQNQGIVIP